MTYIVGCRYYEPDGTENEDPIWAEFSTQAEANAFVESNRDNPDIINIWVDDVSTPL